MFNIKVPLELIFSYKILNHYARYLKPEQYCKSNYFKNNFLRATTDLRSYVKNNATHYNKPK